MKALCIGNDVGKGRIRLPDGRRELRFGRNRIIDANCHESTGGEDLQIAR